MMENADRRCNIAVMIRVGGRMWRYNSVFRRGAAFKVLGGSCSIHRCLYMQVGTSFDGFSESRYAREFLFHHPILETLPKSVQPDTTFESLWKQIDQVAKFNEVTNVLTKWTKEGNVVSREYVNRILVRLYSQAQFNKGFRIAWWVNKEKPYDLIDSDHMLLLQFSTTEGNIKKSLYAFHRIAEKTDVSYITLLQLYVNTAQIEKAEKLMKEMRDLGFVTTPRPYNLMMSIYFRVGRPKDALDMYSELENSNSDSDIFTYYTMMKNKDQLLNFDGLELKAEAALRSQESQSSEHSTMVNNVMMKLYAMLGKEEDLQRIWNNVRSSSSVPLGTYLDVLDAYGLLKNVEKLEELCREVELRCPGKRMIRMQCIIMIRAYSSMGLMEKAEKMILNMKELDHRLGYQTYHHLVAGYMRKNEVEKALEIFQKCVAECANDSRGFHRPFYSTVLLLMKGYEETADVKSAEKLMSMISVNSYPKDARLINGLLKVYLKAKMYAYGIESRMSVLEISPDDDTTALLRQMSV